MSLTVWGPATNSRVLLVLAVAELSGVKVEHKVIEIKDIKDNKEFQKQNPLGQVPVLETPEGCVYQTNAIIRHIARLGTNGLYGTNNTESSHIDQWLDFLNCDVLPAIWAVSAPVFGWAPFDANVDKKGRDDLNRFAEIVNNHLNGKKHFVGTTTSVADVAFAVYFSIAYRTALDASWRSKHANITNLVLSQFEQKALQNNFGRVTSANFPLNAIKIVPVSAPAAAAPAAPAAAAATTAPQKEEKKKEEKKQAAPAEGQTDEGKQKKPAKEPAAKKEEQQPAPKKEEQHDDEEEDDAPKEKKAKNALDELPKSPFDLVAWKMRFVNSTNREEEMKWFWDNIDKEGYSLWDVYYEKFGSEGTVDFKTINLKNGYLQRFDEFRKYVFGTYGVYGEEPKLETKGIWFFRGQELPFVLMDIPGSENHKFTKLDWNNEAHRKKTEESWLAWGQDEDVVVDGLRSRDVTNLR